MKPPFSYGFPMVFLWFSYGFPMVFLWFSYGFPMVFLWFSSPSHDHPGLVQAVHSIQRRPEPRQAAPVRPGEAQATLTIRAGGEAAVLLTGRKCVGKAPGIWFLDGF